jgi:cell wall-associated NlpC family hydrolase
MLNFPTRMTLIGMAAFLMSVAAPAMADPAAHLRPSPGATADSESVPLDEEALLPFFEIAPVERVLQIARSLLGTPYAPGGSRPGGFDCSGLVQYVFRQVGIELPRSSRDQYNHVSRITLQELQPGDLVFFRVARNRISHVGIYMEEDRFIHSPSRGKKVSYDSLSDPYWRSRFAGAGRPSPSEPPG